MPYRQPLQMWQAGIAAALAILSFTTIIVQQASRLTRQQDQIINLQERNSDTQGEIHELKGILKEMSGKLTDIQVAIVNKQDRSK